MADFTRVAGKVRKITKADAALPYGPCYGLMCGIAGTINLHDRTGTLCTDYPLQVGYNPIAANQIRTGGTADNIWALYESP